MTTDPLNRTWERGSESLVEVVVATEMMAWPATGTHVWCYYEHPGAGAMVFVSENAAKQYRDIVADGDGYIFEEAVIGEPMEEKSS